MSISRKISLVFAAGCAGALVNSVVVWYFGIMGLPQKVGVSIAPALTPLFLYPRIVWGGMWGLAFMLPLPRRGFWVGVFSRGILLSFFPTLFQLFVVYPVLQHRGMMGLTLGKLTPVFVFFYQTVWGVSAALWLRMTGEE